MKYPFKTEYRIYENQLFAKGLPSGLVINDDELYLGKTNIGIYIEDNQIYYWKYILPIFEWFKISENSNLFIDPNGDIWSKEKKCIFDRILPVTTKNSEK